MIPQSLIQTLLGSQVVQPENFLSPQQPQDVTVPNNPYNPLLGQLQQDRQGFLDALSQPAPQIPQMQQVSPAYRTPDALKLAALGLASLLFKGQGQSQFLGNALGSYSQSKDQEANQKQAFQNQNAQIGYQNQVNQNNQDRQIAQAKLGFSNEDWQRSENERIKDEQLALQQAQKQDSIDAQSLTNVRNKYSTSKSLGEMKRLARQQAEYEKRLGLQITAPTDQEVEQDFADRSTNAINTINDNWELAKKRILDQYGYVPESEGAQLNSLRNSFLSLGRQYNPKFDLTAVPTETTLKKQKQDEWIQNTEKALKLKERQVSVQERNSIEAIAKMKADIERAKERIALSRQQVGISGFNADTSRMNYELRVKTQQANKAIQGKVDEANAKIQGLKRAQEGTPDITKRQNLQKQIDEYTGQREFWKSQIGDTSAEQGDDIFDKAGRSLQGAGPKMVKGADGVWRPG